jgi:hypothetical protein
MAAVGRWSPAVFSAGGVGDGRRRSSEVTWVSSATSRSSRNGGYGRMEVPNSGETPARDYERFSDLQMGKKG